MAGQDQRQLVELLTLGPFGGIDATTDPLYVAPPNFVDSTNFVPNFNYGGFKLIQGRVNAILGTLPSVPNGMFCFQRQGEEDVYFFACDVPSLIVGQPATGQIFHAKLGQAPQQLELVDALTPGQPTKFVAANQWCFVTNGVDTPIKIDANLKVTNWGIIAPTAAPVLKDAGPGVLLGTYYYCATYGNSVQESSQGTISLPITYTQGTATGTVGISGTPKVGDVLFLTAGQIGVGQGTSSYIVVADASGAAPSIFELATNFANEITADPITSQFVLAQASVPDTGNVNQAQITLTSAVTGANGNFVFYYADHSPDAGVKITPMDEALMTGGTDGGTTELSHFPKRLDSQVTQCNIYRLGGSLGTWNLITTIDYDGTQNTPYYDFTADSAVTGQELVINRDPPPPFAYIATHQERIFGFGVSAYAPNTSYMIDADPSEVWWSNLNEPWGFDAANNTFTCGDNKLGDVAMGMLELGGVLGMLKTRRLFWIYGSTDSDFQPIFAFFIGCDAPLSCATAYGIGFWHSKQGIYYTDGSGYYNISDGAAGQSNVKALLDALDESDFAASCGFIYDRQYYLSFPTQGFTLIYDLRAQSWFKTSFTAPQAVFSLDTGVPVVTAGEKHDAGQILQWFADTQDLGQPITGTLTSRISDGGAQQVIKQLRYGILEAPVQKNVGMSVITYTDGVVADAVTVDLGYGITAHKWSIPVPTATQMQMEAAMTSSTGGVFQKLSTYAWVKRSYGQEDEVQTGPPSVQTIIPVPYIDQVTAQVLGKAVVGPVYARVDQETVQVLGTSSPQPLRVDQETIQVLGVQSSSARVDQELVQILGVQQNNARVDAVSVQVLFSDTVYRIDQETVQVLGTA